MPKSKPKHQGRKTVEQRRRMLERKLHLPRRDADGTSRKSLSVKAAE